MYGGLPWTTNASPSREHEARRLRAKVANLEEAEMDSLPEKKRKAYREAQQSVVDARRSAGK